jgi:hypothetical protein
MCRELSSILNEDEVMAVPIERFKEYCGSPDYHADLEAGLAPKRSNSAPADGNMTPQEFRRSVKRDKTHYTDLKEDKHFNSWNRGFVATAFMHHTHLVLDENYVPTTANDIAVFQEIQTFMYAVLEEHLKTDKGKSLVSQYELDRDAQSIYRELKKHAKSSTAAQISGDSLLQYITTARFPGTWRGTSYAFVLHWKEQVAQYEKLELESFPPKQKLRMLQNSVGDVNEFAYVKQIGDQDIARGNAPLDFDSYLELLLSACSTYDKNYATPMKQKRNVYTTIFEDDNGILSDDARTNERYYEAFNVDTDISEVLAYASAARPINGKPDNFLPRNEWNKLTPSQKEALIAKRRSEREQGKDGFSQQPTKPHVRSTYTM